MVMGLRHPRGCSARLPSRRHGHATPGSPLHGQARECLAPNQALLSD